VALPRATAPTLALLAWALGLGGALGLDDPRLRFPAFALGFGAAQIAAWVAWRSGGGRGVLAAAWGLGAVARLVALGLAPAFSDDVFRYVYEGRVVWATDLGFPFRVPPAEAPAAGVPEALLDEAWRRINHAHVPTIYPPLAQLFFVGAGGLADAAGLPPLTVLKTGLVAVEAATVAALARTAGAARSLAFGWWLCPLAIWAVAREGHVDGLSACALAAGVVALQRGRVALGHAAFATAALAKLNGLVALVASIRRAPRGLAPAAALLALLAVPFAFAGAEAGEGLGAYATRWRSGDGLYGLLSAAWETALGGTWARWGPWTVTRDGLARVTAAGSWALLAAARLSRGGPDPRRAPADAAFLLLILLLCAPTLHPWYALWLVPFLALPGATEHRLALAYLVTTAPLLHWAAWAELSDGVWRDPPIVRAIIHGGTWIALAAEVGARGGQRIVDDPLRRP
jgi:hypothetical protein